MPFPRVLLRHAQILICVAALAVAAFGAEGKPVNYKSGNETVHAILYQPSGKGPFPALVVIHEWWGLVDWVKQQSSNLADQGYVTLAIDLYRGSTTTSAEEASRLMGSVPQDRANRDLEAAYNYLAAQKNVDPKRIGAIGWCMGGGYAMDLALMEPRLKAVVINYGHLASDPAKLRKVNASVLGIFGAQDPNIPVAGVRQFEQEMKGLGKKVEIVVYPDASHAFENPNNQGGYRPEDTADAWKRTAQFLQSNLKQ